MKTKNDIVLLIFVMFLILCAFFLSIYEERSYECKKQTCSIIGGKIIYDVVYRDIVYLRPAHSVTAEVCVYGENKVEVGDLKCLR